MTKVRPLLILLSMTLGTLLLVSCHTVNAKAAIDLSLLTGVWEGSYEYLDYQSDAERIELPSTIVITVAGSEEGPGPAEARLEILYRETGGADVSDEIYLRYFPTESLIEFDGTWAVIETVEDKSRAMLRLVFSGEGDDDDRPALVRHSIERQGEGLILRKEVRYAEATDFILRSEYRLRQTN